MHLFSIKSQATKKKFCSFCSFLAPLLEDNSSASYIQLISATKYKKIRTRWEQWLHNWRKKLSVSTKELKAVNPKYVLRVGILVEIYEKAKRDDYSLIHELQEIMTKPYEEQLKEIEKKYYAKKPQEFFDIAGVSFVSCSS